MYEEKKKSSSSGGTSIATVVMVVFVILKLTGVEPMASWSWAFVIFVPFLVSFAFAFAVIAMVVAVVGVFAGGREIGSWRGRRKMMDLMRKADEEEAREAREAAKRP